VNGLTRIQRETLEFIESCGIVPPTIREMARHFGLRSVHAVTDRLRALQRKGFLEIDAHTARGIRSTRLRRATHAVEWLVPPEDRP
jgi:repressor LexA